MRLEVKPSDRVHMLVWRSREHPGWCCAPAINGLPYGHARLFATWRGALNEAHAEISRGRA